MRNLGFLLGFVLVMGLGPTPSVASPEEGRLAAPPASVSWGTAPETLVVSYAEIWGELANPDPIPLIRVFGDGRVLVHYPDYTPLAGEYELQLEAEELEELLRSLFVGLATFDPQEVAAMKRAEERRRREAALAANESPELFLVADDTTSVFEFHITGYRPEGSGMTSGPIDQAFSWLGVETDAGRYPTLEPIQRLRAAELELRALLEADDLERRR